MIQIANGLEMSLAKQCFDDWLVSIKQQVAVFLEQKKNSCHSKHVKDFSITRSSNIFSIKSNSYILAGNALSTPTWKLISKITFNLGLVKLNHY